VRDSRPATEGLPHRPQGQHQECRPDQQQVDPDVRVWRPRRDQPLPRREDDAAGGRQQESVGPTSRQAPANRCPTGNVDRPEGKHAQWVLYEPTDELDQGRTEDLKLRLLTNPAEYRPDKRSAFSAQRSCAGRPRLSRRRTIVKSGRGGRGMAVGEGVAAALRAMVRAIRRRERGRRPAALITRAARRPAQRQ